MVEQQAQLATRPVNLTNNSTTIAKNQKSQNATIGRTATPKTTALYERLSREDERENESLSIENQKAYLENYAAKNGFTNIVHFTDDGYTGTNFDRDN